MAGTPRTPEQTSQHPLPAAGESLSADAQADLLRRIGQDHDREAFVTLFHFFAPRIKSYLLKRGTDEAAAEEAVQNTFITVWEKAGSYAPEKSAASTWIFTIARNKHIDALRRQKFVIPLEEDDIARIESPAAPPPGEEYADAQSVESLQAAIEALPPEQADLLHMAFFEDKSHQAIADETQLPLGTVKSRLRLAMDKLRHALGATGTTG